MSRRTVTIDADLAAEADRLADGNLSALVSRALEREVRLARLGQLVADFEAEHGALSEDELAAAARRLDDAT